jgi:hypothetical protein
VRPEEALEHARARAARARAEGEDGLDVRGFTVEATEEVTIERLLEWALVEPDPELVRSTRALGAPVTWIKRGLVRVLRQYLGQIVDQQTRFNIQLMAFVSELDDRVTHLEELAGERPPRDASERAGPA